MSEPIPAVRFPSGDPLVRLGTILQEAREAKGLSLDALADQLHMGRDQLQALEAGAHDRLPEKVFVIAQARRVATFLGLEANPLIEDLRRVDFKAPGANVDSTTDRGAAITGATAPVMAPKSSPPTVNTTAPSESSAQGVRWVLAGLGAVVLAVGFGILAVRQQQAMRARVLPSAGSATAPQPAVLAPPAPATAPSPPMVPPQPTTTAAPGSVGPRPASIVVLSSPEGSWIAVRSSFGQVLFQGLLKGERRFPSDGGLKVLAGRPDLVTVRMGGATPRRLGPINEVIWRPLR